MKKTIVVLVILLGAALVAWFLISQFESDEDELLDPKLEQRVDSLQRAKLIDSLRIDSLKKQVSSLQADASAAIARGERTLASVRGLRLTADSLGRAAQASVQNADLWRLAYETRTVEADSLTSAVQNYKRATDSLTVVATKWEDMYNIELDRSRALERLNLDIVADIKRRECKILGFKCPSRTQSFVAGSAFGLGAGLALSN